MNSKKINQENKFINIIRGFAVFLMLWGHCIQYFGINRSNFNQNSVFNVIYSFHMPLFLLVSGYCYYFNFNNRTFKELLIHRTQKLIQPLILGSFLVYLMVDIIYNMYHGKYMTIFSNNHFKYIYQFWFLWSVLSCSVILSLIEKQINNIYIKLLFIAFGFYFVSLFPCSYNNLNMYPFFILGFYFHKLNFSLSNFKFNFVINFIVITIYCYVFKNYYYYMNLLNSIMGAGIAGKINIYLYKVFVGLLGSIIFIIFLYNLYKYCYFNKCFNILNNLGKNSLEVYIISVIILSYYLPIIIKRINNFNYYNIIINNQIVYNYVVTILLAILYSKLCLTIINILRKLKISNIIFGR